MTTTSATSWTRTTAARPSTPDSASGNKTTMIASASPMLLVMIRRPRRAWASAAGMSRRSVPVKATSADSTAAALPVTPIAMPTLADASAGASLIPSPIIAVGVSLARRWTWRALSAGSCSAYT